MGLEEDVLRWLRSPHATPYVPSCAKGEVKSRITVEGPGFAPPGSSCSCGPLEESDVRLLARGAKARKILAFLVENVRSQHVVNNLKLNAKWALHEKGQEDVQNKCENPDSELEEKIQNSAKMECEMEKMSSTLNGLLNEIKLKRNRNEILALRVDKLTSAIEFLQEKENEFREATLVLQRRPYASSSSKSLERVVSEAKDCDKSNRQSKFENIFERRFESELATTIWSVMSLRKERIRIEEALVAASGNCSRSREKYRAMGISGATEKAEALCDELNNIKRGQESITSFSEEKIAKQKSLSSIICSNDELLEKTSVKAMDLAGQKKKCKTKIENGLTEALTALRKLPNKITVNEKTMPSKSQMKKQPKPEEDMSAGNEDDYNVQNIEKWRRSENLFNEKETEEFMSFFNEARDTIGLSSALMDRTMLETIPLGNQAVIDLENAIQDLLEKPGLHAMRELE